MQHPHDLSAAWDEQIGDDVTAHREATQAFGQLLPSPPQSALLRQQLKLLIDQVNERIGLIVAVFGDELPDVRKIGLGPGLKSNLRHGLTALGGGAGRGLAPPPVLLGLVGAPGHGRATSQTLLDIGAQLLELKGAQLVLLLHEAQGFAHDLTGGGVKTRSNFGLDHGFELGGEIDIHRHDDPRRACLDHHPAQIGKTCQSLTFEAAFRPAHRFVENSTNYSKSAGRRRQKRRLT